MVVCFKKILMVLLNMCRKICEMGNGLEKTRVDFRMWL